MDVTRERINRTFELRERFLSFQTGFNLVNAAVVCAVLESISSISYLINPVLYQRAIAASRASLMAAKLASEGLSTIRRGKSLRRRTHVCRLHGTRHHGERQHHRMQRAQAQCLFFVPLLSWFCCCFFVVGCCSCSALQCNSEKLSHKSGDILSVTAVFPEYFSKTHTCTHALTHACTHARTHTNTKHVRTHTQRVFLTT